MFNIGPAELLVIGLVLLIAVGPEQLPGVIRRVGSTVAQLRSMTDGLRSEFMAGLDEIERATDVERWVADDSDADDSDADDSPADDSASGPSTNGSNGRRSGSAGPSPGGGDGDRVSEPSPGEREEGSP